MEALAVLAAFGSTGRVGPLYPGARLREVAAVCGMPWDIGRIKRNHRWPHLYSYGDVEFVVCRCRIVTSVTVQTWRETVELPGQAQSGEVITLSARLTFAQVVDALAAADCQWEQCKATQGHRALRTLPQRVDFTFVTDDGAEPMLHVAGTWSHDHDCISTATVAAAFSDDFPPEQSRNRPPLQVPGAGPQPWANRQA